MGGFLGNALLPTSLRRRDADRILRPKPPNHSEMHRSGGVNKVTAHVTFCYGSCYGLSA